MISHASLYPKGLHSQNDLIDTHFALIYLGASLPDCPPDSGGECSITLMLCPGWLHRSSSCQYSLKWSAGLPEIQALDGIKLALAKSRPGLGSLSCSQLTGVNALVQFHATCYLAP